MNSNTENRTDVRYHQNDLLLLKVLLNYWFSFDDITNKLRPVTKFDKNIGRCHTTSVTTDLC